MTSLKQNKSNSSKKPNPNSSYAPIKNLDAPSSFQVKNNLKQLTNTQEAIHLETIGLIEDRLFKKLSRERG